MDSEPNINDIASFNKHTVGLTSLEMLLHCLKIVEQKKTYWQWVYISLHSAVQAYMVLALTGIHNLLAYRDQDAELWLRNYSDGLQLPDCNLDSFLGLYRKTKSDRMLL